MRISEEERNYLFQRIKLLDPKARIYLFGSRASDYKKGGDIDIMILSERKFGLEEKTQIRYGFIEKFGEQRIDLINYTFEEENHFKLMVLNDSVEIT